MICLWGRTVFRDWKRKVTDPGAAPTFSEKSSYRERLEIAFKRKQPLPKSKAQAAPPLVPNYLCARGFGGAMLVGTGLSLAAFQSDMRLSIALKEGRVYFTLKSDLPAGMCVGNQTQRACCTLAGGSRRLALQKRKKREVHTMADCGSIGYGMAIWLFTAGGTFGTHATDIFAHDQWNSVKMALEDSGMWLVVLEVALLSNYTKGKLNKDAKGNELRDAALDFFSMIDSEGVDNSIFLDSYEDIACELGLYDEWAMWTPEHIAAVIAAARDSKSLSNDGSAVKLARWFSVYGVFDEKLRHAWHLKKTINIHMGVTKGTFSVPEDLYVATFGKL